MKFRTVDRRLGSSRRSASTVANVDTVESLLLSQEDKPQSDCVTDAKNCPYFLVIRRVIEAN